MHDVKNMGNYTDSPLRETHWYIKYLTEKIYNDYNSVVLFWNFYQLSKIDVNLFKKLVYILLTQKQLFHRKLFKKSFPLKCSLNIPWMSRTLLRWGHTQRIFPEYCVPAGLLSIASRVLLLRYVEFNRFL